MRGACGGRYNEATDDGFEIFTKRAIARMTESFTGCGIIALVLHVCLCVCVFEVVRQVTPLVFPQHALPVVKMQLVVHPLCAILTASLLAAV